MFAGNHFLYTNNTIMQICVLNCLYLITEYLHNLHNLHNMQRNWDQEMSFLTVLQSLMNMYSRGESKEYIFGEILDHLIAVTNSENGLIAKLIDKDGKNFHNIISYKMKDKMSNDMQQYVDTQGGYYISIDDNEQSLLNKIYCTHEKYVIQNEMSLKKQTSNMPKDHFKVNNMLGVPLRHKNVIYGMICLSNRKKNGQLIDFDEDLFEKIEPFMEICNLLLHSFHLSVLESIYKRIVQNLAVPITVYQGTICYSSSVDILDILDQYRCIIVNKSFCKRACPPDNEVTLQLQNHTLFESFPNFKGYSTLLEKIRIMFESKSSQHEDCIEYEDYLFSKSQYQFQFCYVDDHTFIMSIDDISDKILAKQVADNIVKSKEEFIANISHEMRTPLNGIIGYTALIMDTPLNEYQKDCFSTIRECSMNLLYRVNDLLDLSKLTAGKMELMEEDFSLSDCISASYDVNSLDAKQKVIDVAYFIEPDVPNIIKGDSHKLQQILVNLLNNAIKFTDHGKINTHVRVIDNPITQKKLDVRNKYTIEFTVSDTGIGIEEEDLSKLFTPFNQVHPNDRVNHGTGLGLVITKKLCELMGGNIKASSVFGKGSKFIFYIKVQGNDIYEINTEKEKYLLSNKNVLVVDDNETNRIMICSFLSEWGIKPISCSSAKEALFYIEKSIIDFDLALLDMRMPNKNGNELAMDIYKMVPNLPLVALSSVLLPAHKINKHFKYYLTKPIKCRKLKQICLDIFNAMESGDRVTYSSANQSRSVLKDNTLSTRKILPLSSPGSKYFIIPHTLNMKKYTRAKIILAEDLYINQKVTIQILHKLGYKNIDLAEDGKKLLNKIKSSEDDYDIILMDLKMPVMDGFEASIEINRLYQTQKFLNRIKPKIIAVTARVMSGVRQKCLEVGMDDYITKPMELQLLNDKIIALLH